MHKILVPLDGSGHSWKALSIAGDLAQKYEGSLALLHIVPEGRTLSDLLRAEIVQELRADVIAEMRQAGDSPKKPIPTELMRGLGTKILQAGASRARRRGIETAILDLEKGDPAEAILLTQKRIGANTIVMGTRGASSTNTSVFGSVSDKVFEQAECTCISVK